MKIPCCLLVLCALPLLAHCGADAESPSLRYEGGYRYAADPGGADTPARGCVVCHSLEADGPLRVAPTLWGIVGAQKARFGWYGYSKALATAGGEWTEEHLHEYLTDPDKFLPGTKKTLIGITDEKQRSELIEFLKTLRN